MGFIWELDLFGSWVSFGGWISFGSWIYLGAGFHLGDGFHLGAEFIWELGFVWGRVVFFGGGVGTNKAPYRWTVDTECNYY